MYTRSAGPRSLPHAPPPPAAAAGAAGPGSPLTRPPEVRRTLPERVTGEELGAGARADGSRFLFLWGSIALGALQKRPVRGAPANTRRCRHAAAVAP